MFMTDRLTKANIKGDKSELEHVIKILETLHSGWVEAINKLKRDENVNK